MKKGEIRVGDSAAVSKTLTETDVYAFAGICGDFNPIHINSDAAQKSRFGRRICHGLLVSSFISTVLGMYLPGTGCIYLEQSLKFINPVFINDTITATVIVQEIQGNIVRLKTIVENQEGITCVTGDAKVMI